MSKESLQREQTLIRKLDSLQNRHYNYMDDAVYFKREWENRKTEAQRMEDEIYTLLDELRSINPNTDYELDSDYL